MKTAVACAKLGSLATMLLARVLFDSRQARDAGLLLSFIRNVPHSAASVTVHGRFRCEAMRRYSNTRRQALCSYKSKVFTECTNKCRVGRCILLCASAQCFTLLPRCLSGLVCSFIVLTLFMHHRILHVRPSPLPFLHQKDKLCALLDATRGDDEDCRQVLHHRVGELLRAEASFVFFCEDDEAVTKMIIKVWSPHMRYESRTHRVSLDWLFERIHQNSNISVKYVHTHQQIAEIFTKSSFAREKWKESINLFGTVLESSDLSPFSVVAALVPSAHQVAKKKPSNC